MSDSINENLAKNALRLGNEVRDLAKERDALKEHIKYLEAELNCETGRWERALDENARLKAEVERLRKAGDAMADAFPSPNFPREHYALKAWNAAKEGKQS